MEIQGQSLQGRQRFWESRLRNVTWFPVERWLDLPLCEGFQYVVTLREPVPRVLHQPLEGKEWHHQFVFFFGGVHVRVTRVTGDQLIDPPRVPLRVSCVVCLDYIKLDETPESTSYGVLPSGSSASTTRFHHFFSYFRESLSILAGRFARFQGFSLTNTHDVPHSARTDACQANLAGIIWLELQVHELNPGFFPIAFASAWNLSHIWLYDQRFNSHNFNFTDAAESPCSRHAVEWHTCCMLFCRPLLMFLIELFVSLQNPLSRLCVFSLPFVVVNVWICGHSGWLMTPHRRFEALRFYGGSPWRNWWPSDSWLFGVMRSCGIYLKDGGCPGNDWSNGCALEMMGDLILFGKANAKEDRHPPAENVELGSGWYRANMRDMRNWCNMYSRHVVH